MEMVFHAFTPFLALIQIIVCFIVGKAFKCQVRSLKTVRPLQRGDIIVETTSKSQSDRVLSLKDLAGVPVVVTPHRSLTLPRVLSAAEI